jgi:hypothetical protein
MNVYFNSTTNAGPKKGSAGTESEWQSLCDFELRGQRLQMVEKRIIGGRHDEDSVTIAAAPGSYRVEYRLMSYGVDRRISRMRVLPKGVSATLGEAAGCISVDLGGIAIADIDVLAPSVEEHADEYENWIKDLLFSDDGESVGVARWKAGDTALPYADGGFGDGAYTVYQLMSDGRAAGLEVEFIPAGTPYPF